MRLALPVLVLVFSLTASAAPKVGDKIHRKGFFTSQGKTGAVTLDTEIISYDSNTQQFLVRDTVAAEGSSKPEVTDTLKKASEITANEDVAVIMANCASYGGNHGSQVIAGQTFEVCSLTVDNGTCKGTTQFAYVPFGTLSLDVSCPSQGIDRLVLPADASQGGEFSFAWGN